jgi:para-aminobenzoate synthetase component 1
VSQKVSFTDIVMASFPMGSMTGAPKRSAMQLIRQFEKSSRGLYSGSVGYITPEGDFDFNVVIRSILYDSNLPKVSAGVGSAITAACIPEFEYEECLLKADALFKALSSQR